MHRIATLPGTNFAMRISLIRALGGWDEAGVDGRLGTEHPDHPARIPDQVHPVRRHVRTGAAGVEGLGAPADALGAGEQLRDREVCPADSAVREQAAGI